MVPPYSLRIRVGSAPKSVFARALPNALLRRVSNSDPCHWLVPLLVVRMMLVGRLNFAEGALFSTRNSWIVSRPGGRMFSAFAVHRIGERGAIEDEIVRALANAVRAHLRRSRGPEPLPAGW